jgi:hypothetical protein
MLLHAQPRPPLRYDRPRLPVSLIRSPQYSASVTSDSSRHTTAMTVDMACGVGSTARSLRNHLDQAQGQQDERDERFQRLAFLPERAGEQPAHAGEEHQALRHVTGAGRCARPGGAR